ncbi:MAG: DUF4131 domain-containing protein [Dehalococcoidales bacterium]|nr:DUF4131 domain-containing protein [Dehalococcoidales bacterium]
MLLIYLSCVWIIGILLGSKFGIAPVWLLLSLLPLPSIMFFRRRKKPIIVLSLLILVFLGGIIRYHSVLPVIDENHIRFYNERGTVELKGTVNTAPDVRDKTTHIYLSVTEIRDGSVRKEVEGQVLLFVPRYPAYDYGDELLVSGELVTPRSIDDFDYRGYLANQGIYSTMFYPEIEVQDTGKGFPPLSWIYSLRERLS